MLLCCVGVVVVVVVPISMNNNKSNEIGVFIYKSDNYSKKKNKFNTFVAILYNIIHCTYMHMPKNISF